MPVDGLPDPAIHKRCYRCGEWFEELDGRMVEKTRSGPAGIVLEVVDRLIGDPRMQFICDGCYERRDRGSLVLLIVLVVALVGIGAYFVVR